MKTIYLGLGSNLGDRQQNLLLALAALEPEVTIQKTSFTCETDAMYNVGQPKFLNVVCEAVTQLPPFGVLRKIKKIEMAMGRHAHNEPRVIDIDLLFYGNEIMETQELKVPHPSIAERAFVLVPMADIAPRFTHPILHCTIAELRDRLGVVSGIQKI